MIINNTFISQDTLISFFQQQMNKHPIETLIVGSSPPDSIVKIPPVTTEIHSKEQLKQKINQLRQEDNSKLLNREWNTLNPESQSKHSLRVMQFNLLAEGLSSGERTPPFDSITESDYGGFIAVPNKSNIFNFERRCYYLLEEIIRTDPDVVSLEEIDRIDFFVPAMKSFGYTGAFQPKADSPCTRFGYYSDGVAIFWKESKFELKSKPFLTNNFINPDNGNRKNCCAVAVKLSCLENSREIIVIGTHLKAKMGIEEENIRLSQIKHILSDSNNLLSDTNSNVILLGDFNTAPHEEKKGIPATVIPFVRSLDFSSSYPLGESALPTTAKIRSTGCAEHVIDYIWMGQLFETKTILSIPRSQLDDSTLLPCASYPSDHFAIAADLVWKD